MVDVEFGHPDFGKAIPCPCRKEERKAKRIAFLRQMDGLTDDERAKSFANIDNETIADTIIKVRQATIDQRGLLTLYAPPGYGKTTLLICAINEARNNNKLAVYTTVTDLLAYLRSTFRPDAEIDFDRYWDALIECDVLALDEMDEFNTTPWAMERFLRLIDERWRRMDEVLTLCAINNPIQTLPPKVQSRLGDGRSQTIKLAGRDMRPLNAWE